MRLVCPISTIQLHSRQCCLSRGYRYLLHLDFIRKAQSTKYKIRKPCRPVDRQCIRTSYKTAAGSVFLAIPSVYSVHCIDFHSIMFTLHQIHKHRHRCRCHRLHNARRLVGGHPASWPTRHPAWRGTAVTQRFFHRRVDSSVRPSSAEYKHLRKLSTALLFPLSLTRCCCCCCSSCCGC